jgi:hypothetical protein
MWIKALQQWLERERFIWTSSGLRYFEPSRSVMKLNSGNPRSFRGISPYCANKASAYTQSENRLCL